MSKGRERVAIYPGSFDPPTFGHVDIMERALHVFDKLIVAVARNVGKDCLFTPDERVAMLTESVNHIDGVEVDSFDSLTVEYAKIKDATAIVRGLRAVSDFEYEFQMALMNRKLAPSIETIYLMPKDTHIFLSSSLIKEIAMFGGRDLSKFVPPAVERKLVEKFRPTDS
jgi:pantetheine-phosphate adenylyltransferase